MEDGEPRPQTSEETEESGEQREGSANTPMLVLTPRMRCSRRARVSLATAPSNECARAVTFTSRLS